MQRFVQRLPLLGFLIIGGAVLAQGASTASRTFPYVGYLEENGVAVSGSRDVAIDLFTAQSGGSACDSEVFSGVAVSAGRFQVEYPDVPSTCLTAGELWITLSVGAVGGTRTTLATASGDRVRVHSLPFAMAVDKAKSFLVGSGGVITLERLGGQNRIFGDAGGVATIVQPVQDIPDVDAIFAVLSSNGTSRLRVEDNNRVLIGERLEVTGAVSATGTVTAAGAVNVSRSANVARINFPVGAGGNDAASIEHFESGDVGELWLNSSDNWGTTGGAGTENDRVVLGDRAQNVVRHEFDAVGDAFHGRDVVVARNVDVAGSVSSSCPSGMSFAGGFCIDNVVEGGATHGNAMNQCNNEGKMVCPYAAYMAADHFQPGDSQASARTRDGSSVLWTAERHNTRSELGESWHTNILCWNSNNRSGRECSIGESLQYFCCTHAYPGAN